MEEDNIPSQLLPSSKADCYRILSSRFKSLVSLEDAKQIWRQTDISCMLCFLFGTEEYVSLRRELALLREEKLSKDHVLCNVICSGSLGEGVAYPPSDDDILVCIRTVRAVESYENATQANDFLMVPSEYSAGYCLLLDISGLSCTGVIRIINERPFLSSTLFKEFVRCPSLNVFYIHGPCLKLSSEEVDIDLAISIACSSLPSAAKEWTERDRYYGWPSPEIIQDIEQSGCHLVPIGDPYSNYRDHEWRISFSIAERKLVHSFNHAQFLIYNLLRYALKMVIDEQFPDVLCSYFMKTTLFHTIERTPRQMWREDNLEICFIVCLSILYNFIDYKNCPNYFILEYNMIKRKVNDTNKQKLLDSIRLLIKEGIFGVLLPQWIHAYLDKTGFLKYKELKLDRGLLHSYNLAATIDSLSLVDVLPSYENDSYTSSICSLLHISQRIETRNKFINIILRIGILYQYQILLNRLLTSGKQNKQSFILHKTIQSLLQKLIHKGDVSTAKLTMATYMCLIGKTLLVIQKLLSKYPPYAIESTTENIVKGYMDTLCNKGYTIEEKARHAWAPHFSFLYFDLDVFPLPMKIWLSIKQVSSIHPLTYALVLENLCHLQIQNTSSWIKSTKNLLNHLDYLKNGIDIANAKLLIGIIKLVQGDDESAYAWFGSVYMMKNKLHSPSKEIQHVSEAALMYIACLIYQQRFLPELNWKMVSIVSTDIDLD